MTDGYHGGRQQQRTSGGDGEQVTLKRVRNWSDADQPGCGGLEPDLRLANDQRSSTALFGPALVAASHAPAGMNPKR